MFGLEEGFASGDSEDIPAIGSSEEPRVEEGMGSEPSVDPAVGPGVGEGERSPEGCLYVNVTFFQWNIVMTPTEMLVGSAGVLGEKEDAGNEAADDCGSEDGTKLDMADEGTKEELGMKLEAKDDGSCLILSSQSSSLAVDSAERQESTRMRWCRKLRLGSIVEECAASPNRWELFGKAAKRE